MEHEIDLDESFSQDELQEILINHKSGIECHECGLDIQGKSFSVNIVDKMSKISYKIICEKCKDDKDLRLIKILGGLSLMCILVILYRLFSLK